MYGDGGGGVRQHSHDAEWGVPIRQLLLACPALCGKVLEAVGVAAAVKLHSRVTMQAVMRQTEVNHTRQPR